MVYGYQSQVPSFRGEGMNLCVFVHCTKGKNLALYLRENAISAFSILELGLRIIGTSKEVLSPALSLPIFPASKVIFARHNLQISYLVRL